jgi:hypothetical protein
MTKKRKSIGTCASRRAYRAVPRHQPEMATKRPTPLAAYAPIARARLMAPPTRIAGRAASRRAGSTAA